MASFRDFESPSIQTWTTDKSKTPDEGPQPINDVSWCDKSLVSKDGRYQIHDATIFFSRFKA